MDNWDKLLEKYFEGQTNLKEEERLKVYINGPQVSENHKAYRMLFGHPPHALKPGMNVLIWGASGGIGSMAVQICKAVGANAIGIISDDDKIPFVKNLGAVGVLNRKNYDCFGQLPDVKNPESYSDFIKKCRVLGKDIWEITGKKDGRKDYKKIICHFGTRSLAKVL